MKMTADQLLKIAGITPTTTLRARLNESAGNTKLNLRTLTTGDHVRVLCDGKLKYEFTLTSIATGGGHPDEGVWEWGMAAGNENVGREVGVYFDKRTNAVYPHNGWEVELVKKAGRRNGSVNESANSGITQVDYTYQIRYNGADAEAFHPNGEESQILHGNTLADQQGDGGVSTHMTQSDYNKIQKVLDFLVEEGFQDFNDDEQEYEGDVGVMFDRALEEHKLLFGPGVKATFRVSEVS